ncbi:MAG: transposase, partial [Bacillota bacterium]|nr:transposase [Bacillota bacterium]
IVDEVVEVLGYHRKYAIQVLKETKPRRADKRKRKRVSKYFAALPAILLAWKALDYPCAERLHPVLLQTAELAHLLPYVSIPLPP